MARRKKSQDYEALYNEFCGHFTEDGRYVLNQQLEPQKGGFTRAEQLCFEELNVADNAAKSTNTTANTTANAAIWVLPDSPATDRSIGDVLRHGEVTNYREKVIISGNVLEVSIFPIWKTKEAFKVADEAMKKLKKEEYKRMNDKNSAKRLVRLVDTNFGKDDYSVTLTYADGDLPDEDHAKKDVKNFLDKLRRRLKKNGVNETNPLKYIYVAESFDGDGRRKRVHHHVILSGGLSREEIKGCWSKGRARIDELEPENGSLAGLAHYITKQPVKDSQKKWVSSKNLDEPIHLEHNSRISKRKAEQLATDAQQSGADIFGKHYPDYILDECVVKRSDYVAGAYIYAKMHKKPTNAVRSAQTQKLKTTKTNKTNKAVKATKTTKATKPTKTTKTTRRN